MKMDIEGSEGKVLVDLVKKKQLSKIEELIIEYHHNIPGNSVSLSSFLQLLETQFHYQLDTSSIPIYSKNKFQDVLIFAYKK